MREENLILYEGTNLFLWCEEHIVPVGCFVHIIFYANYIPPFSILNNKWRSQIVSQLGNTLGEIN